MTGRQKRVGAAVRLTNIALAGAILHVAVTTILSFYEAKRLAPIEGEGESPPVLPLAEIGAGLRFSPPPRSTTTTSAPSPADGLELTALLIDPSDEGRSVAVFADREGSIMAQPGETLRSGVRLVSLATEGAVVATTEGERRMPLKKSVPPAAAYIAETTPIPTPTPSPPQGIIIDDPEGKIVRTLWPPMEDV